MLKPPNNLWMSMNCVLTAAAGRSVWNNYCVEIAQLQPARTFWTVSAIRWLPFMHRPCLQLETKRERERERGCVEENHKISNGGKTAKTVWDYILSHYDVPLKILPVRITRAGIKHLLHVWKKQCRNVTIWSSINDFICIEHLFPDESLSDSESGPRMWKHHCSLVVHAVHVCSVKARKGKKKKKHGTLCTWSGLRTPEE